jgi:hypothetical protein
MTDPVNPDPTPAATPVPPAAPAAPAAPVYAPAATGAKKALSLTSFILGLFSVVFFWTSWFALIVGIAAVVLGFIGRSREKDAPKWMALVGIIAGFVGIVLSAIIIIIAIALVASNAAILNNN